MTPFTKTSAIKTSTTKQRIFWLVLAILIGTILLIQARLFDAAADAKPDSVSLHSPTTFPIDI